MYGYGARGHSRIDETDGAPNGSVEPHTVCSACLLVVALLCQSIAAPDPPVGVGDAPSSLRVSSLVTILIYSSPELRGCGIIKQRFVFLVILVALSFAGEHYAGPYSRIGDVVFTGLTMLMAVQVFHTGGIESSEVRPDSEANASGKHRRQTVSGLCSGLLLYVGLRGFRLAFSSAEEARTYAVQYVVGEETIQTYGYAHSTPACSIPLGFGYGVAIGTAIVVGFHSEAHDVGSGAIAFEVATCAVAMAVAALWAMLGMSEQFDALTPLYGVGACAGDRDLCKEAYRARRFVAVNNSTAPLWITALAAAVFSFAVEKRLKEEKILQTELARALELLKREGFGAGCLLATLAVFAAFSYSSIEGEQYHTDIVFILSLISIFVSMFGGTLTGSSIYILSMGYEKYRLVDTYGTERVYNHLTHVTLTVALICMSVHVLVATFKEVCFMCSVITKSVKIDTFLAIVAIFGTSLSCGLYIASCLMISGTNGGLPDDEALRDSSGKRTMITFILDHFVPFFAWVPLYACRCEVQCVDWYTRVTAYCVAVPFVVSLYLIVLAVMDAPAPSMLIVEMVPTCLAAVGGLTAWATGAFV